MIVRATASGHPHPLEVLDGAVSPMETLRRCGRTFFWASRILPPSARRDLALLYAFCRVVDDCGDTIGVDGRPPGDALSLLGEIEAGLRSERSGWPLVRSFRELAARHGIPVVHAEHLIEGVRSDVGAVRMRTSGELLRYAYRVASTVGLMMCRVLNVPRAGDPFAVDLGIAMQLTNIARDVGEDALADRVYLPASWIDPRELRRGLEGRDVSATRASVEAVERLLRLADRYYDSADRGMRYMPMAVRPGIRAAAANYRAIGGVVRRDPARALVERARTGGASKLGRTGVAAGRAALDGWVVGRSADHDERLHAAVAPLRAEVAAA